MAKYEEPEPLVEMARINMKEKRYGAMTTNLRTFILNEIGGTFLLTLRRENKSRY